MKLCILGMGSIDCKDLEKNLHLILKELGIDSEIALSDDIDLFLKYKITKTPALLINDYLIHNENLQENCGIREQIIAHLDHFDKNHKAS